LLPFVRGAPWRAFLAKYPEVNQLQKRMTLVSDNLHAVGAGDEATRELYRAQCNCSYWHGAFGGVYLAFMRTALWHHLMRAEAALKLDRSIRIVDVDADARDEIVMTAPWGAAVVSTHDARVVELDDWTFGANLLAVAARHREAYHVADEGPDDEDEDSGDAGEIAITKAQTDVDRASLTFDEEPLGGLIDLVDGRRVTGPYSVEVDGDTVVFTTTASDRLGITKKIRALDDGLECTHTLSNRSRSKVDVEFSSETSALPLSLGRGTVPDEVEVTATGWRMEQPDGEVGLHVDVEPAASISLRPIETASATLEALTWMHQGTSVTTTWSLSIERGGSATIRQALRPVVNRDAASKEERGVSA
jgi:hypothetical protein